ncbi:DUF222 domain-containing protein, partial [Nocardioides campestrisoli]|uniref:DUF222 domain-containing protein n=1 Tax=Nocardioides campestrisoli TaxID=2736757 RepID=UPI0015E7AD68
MAEHVEQAHPITRACTWIDEALSLASSVDPGGLSGQAHRDALLHLTSLGDRLESLRMRVIHAAGRPGGVAEDDGARSPASWLAARTRSGFGAPRAAEKLAEAVTDRWRLVGAGLEAGRVNVPQARVIVKVLDALVVDPVPGEEVSPEVLALAEAHLVEQAGVFDPGQLERLGAKILEVVAPETADEHERRVLERAERRAQAATRLTFRRRGDGATDVVARVPDHVAARLKTYLEAWTSPRQDASAEAGAATPFGGFAQRDSATGVRLPQERLRGQAFCAFLEAADPTRMPVHGGGATRVVVTIGLAELRSELGLGTIISNGESVTSITAAEARRLACQAGIIPAVLGSDSVPMDLGRSSRFFTPGQRLAKSLTHLVCAA